MATRKFFKKPSAYIQNVVRFLVPEPIQYYIQAYNIHLVTQSL
jgi:hypothetical protein